MRYYLPLIVPSLIAGTVSAVLGFDTFGMEWLAITCVAVISVVCGIWFAVEQSNQ